MKKITQPGYYYTTDIIKDSVGQNYLAVNITIDLLLPYFEKLYEVLPEDHVDYMSTLKFERDRGAYHITVLAAHEFKYALNFFNIKSHKEIACFLTLYIDDIVFHGIGVSHKNNNVAYYIVCTSEKLNKLRSDLKLPPKDFHVTLAFKDKDVHGVPKSKVVYTLD